MRRELILQGGVFIVSSVLLLLLLSAAVHFQAGRLLFAILIAGVCLIAELFLLFKVARLLWRWSNKVALAILRAPSADATSPSLLTDAKD